MPDITITIPPAAIAHLDAAMAEHNAALVALDLPTVGRRAFVRHLVVEATRDGLRNKRGNDRVADESASDQAIIDDFGGGG